MQLQANNLIFVGISPKPCNKYFAQKRLLPH